VRNPVLLYDGVCGLCNRVVRFVLRHDSAQIFRFASLQSEYARCVLARHGLAATEMNTVYLVVERGADDSLLERSDAVVFVLRQLGGIWLVVACILRGLPRGIRDWAYRVVARNRYRAFGSYETCPVPDEGVRERFLDL